MAHLLKTDYNVTMKRNYLLLLILGVSLASYGFWSSKVAENNTDVIVPATPKPDTSAPATTAPAATGTETPAATATVTKIIKVYCPETYKLVKKELFWGAEPGWRSYAQSFDTEIQSFLGAKWTGINVGKMACIYSGTKKFGFPIILQNDQLVPPPTGGKWGELHDGNVECHSNDPNLCEFKYEKQETDIKRVYEELQFKKAPDNQEP